MREDVMEAKRQTFNATWVGGLAFTVPSLMIGLLITAGDGMGAWGGATMLGVAMGAALSATVAFWIVTRKRMNLRQTMATTGAYILGLAAILSAVGFGFPPIATWTMNTLGEIGQYIVGITAMAGLVSWVGLPSLFGTVLAKNIYPRFAMPFETKR